MLVRVVSATHAGLETLGVEVEVNTAARGLPAFEIVGLPGKGVAESKERVRTAIVNSHLEFPQRRITVNLAPADVPKEGSFYDLPIAVGILASVTGCSLPPRSLFFGELSLDGSLRHTRGALLLALHAKAAGLTRLFVPKDSANEAAVVGGVMVYPLENLEQMLAHLQGRTPIEPLTCPAHPPQPVETSAAEFDMAEILGQEQAKRALEIAAAGGHNVLLMGSPGAGKTMLARALPGILPPLTEAESLEVTTIYSASGRLPPGGSLLRTRPFRAPHHTISAVGLVGGGVRPQPGEVSLAHRGVLFLDEFYEFPRAALEGLRQPLEDGRVSIVRSRERVTYPSRVTLVASANPCPCGYLGHPRKPCACTPREIRRYRRRASGPLLDRVDLHVHVPAVEPRDLSSEHRRRARLEPSARIRARVVQARAIQGARFAAERLYVNAEMRPPQLRRYGRLAADVERMALAAVGTFQLSARAYVRLIKVARTIADLAGASEIGLPHVAEALQYRLRADS